MDKANKFALALVLTMVVSSPALAAGGLDKGTDVVEEIRVWLYTLTGVISVAYLVFNIIKAMMEKQTWNDVLVALAKVAAAGGSVTAANFAWGIWGS